MLSKESALRFAESAAGLLRRRDLRQWLNQAIVITSEDGKKHGVLDRRRAIELLEKARETAVAAANKALADDLTHGIDVVKATAPVDVPVIVFIERDDGEIEAGVIAISLPLETKFKA